MRLPWAERERKGRMRGDSSCPSGGSGCESRSDTAMITKKCCMLQPRGRSRAGRRGGDGPKDGAETGREEGLRRAGRRGGDGPGGMG